MSTNAEYNIMLFRLANAEEIMCKVIKEFDEENSNVFMCVDVVQLLRDVDEQGKMKMGMVDYMPYTDGSFVLFKNNIVGMAFPTDSLVASYNQKFSKIVMPPKQGIIT